MTFEDGGSEEWEATVGGLFAIKNVYVIHNAFT